MRTRAVVVRRRTLDAGAALIETLVAVAIIAVVTVAVTGLASQSLAVAAASARADAVTREADALFRAASLWTRDDLDRRLGDRAQGDWWMSVDRPSREIYRLSLRRTEDGPEILWTVLYRPEASRSDP
ncbi:MAG: hypothetical protein MJB57_15830 [Gemmatimonadetes bacterium]|nr:hypothetical protein [Gemmatimonadota bacterium]